MEKHTQSKPADKGRSSETNNSNVKCGATERKAKVNKNAILRKSKPAQKMKDNLEKSPESPVPGTKERVPIKTELSSPDVDGDADSAIGSDVMSIRSMSFDEDQLLDDMHNLDLQTQNESLSLQGSVFTQIAPVCARQPKFMLPKVTTDPPTPVPTSVGTERKTIFQHAQTQNEGGAESLNASEQDGPVSNTEDTSGIRSDGPQLDVRIDGPQSGIEPVIRNQLRASISTAAQGGMSDFVILYTDVDMEATQNYKIHLHAIGIPDLTVDLFSNIDAGKTDFQSLKTLHDKYRFILIYVTENLVEDRYCRFLQEIIITFGLREGNGKEDRVVPVFTKSEKPDIIEISIIRGLQYFRFDSGRPMLRKMYCDSVKTLVVKGRQKFP